MQAAIKQTEVINKEMTHITYSTNQFHSIISLIENTKMVAVLVHDFIKDFHTASQHSYKYSNQLKLGETVQFSA